MCLTPKILLVEDEPIIASHLEKMIELFGYRVLLASDGATALSLFSLHLPHLAILNFHQKNEKDGMSIARILQSRYRVKILFVTGARAQDLLTSPDFYAGYEVLYKPFTSRQFRKALSDFLL